MEVLLYSAIHGAGCNFIFLINRLDGLSAFTAVDSLLFLSPHSFLHAHIRIIMFRRGILAGLQRFFFAPMRPIRPLGRGRDFAKYRCNLQWDMLK